MTEWWRCIFFYLGMIGKWVVDFLVDCNHQCLVLWFVDLEFSFVVFLDICCFGFCCVVFVAVVLLDMILVSLGPDVWEYLWIGVELVVVVGF